MEKKINRNDVEDIFSLSEMQRSMLFTYLSDPKKRIYVEQLDIEIIGRLDHDILDKRWENAVKNNEMLRTIFRWDKLPQPLQIVLKEKENPIIYKDGMSNNKMFKFLKSEEENIDLQENPIRLSVILTDEQSQHLIITYHHILFDGWSLSYLIRLLLDDIIEPKEKMHYKKFVNWEQQQNKTEQMLFWRKYFENCEMKSILPLSTENNSEIYPESVSYHTLQIPQYLHEKITDFVRKQQITLAVFTYGIIAILLKKCQNKNDFVFGITVSGRSITLTGIEECIGLFINTIPLRCSFKSEDTFLTLLKKIQECYLLQSQYDNTPLSSIQNYIKAKEKIIGTLVVVENYPIDTAYLNNQADVYIKQLHINEMTSFDLTFELSERNNLELKITYNNKLYEEEIIHQLSEFCLDIIQWGIENSDKTITEISLYHNYSFLDCNKNLVEMRDSYLLEGFRKQAYVSGKRPAILSPMGEINYLEFHQKSNQVAHYLVENEIGSECLVGIIFDRTVEMLIAVYGILKAGAAYMPIDKDYPESRIRYMLGDSNIVLLLTADELPERLLKGYPHVALNSIFSDSTYSKQDIVLQANSSRLIYMIYTSGSTGKPKGAMVQLNAFENLLYWYINELSIGINDCIMLLTSHSFDQAQKNLFATLLQGGRLCLPAPGPLDYQIVSESIYSNNVTIINCTPSMFYILLEVNKLDNYERLRPLRTVVLGGEPIDVFKLRDWQQVIEYRCEIINTYGPTECTDTNMFYRVKPEEIYLGKPIPLGKAIPNNSIYVLDDDLVEMPIGAIGQLYIGGIAVGRGYYNNSKLTEQKFLVHPKTGERLYKTGDLVKRTKDGKYEFYGRNDHQIKIRGFRVDLIEIENCLMDIEAITRCAVIVKYGLNGGEIICGFYESSYEIPTQKIKEYLNEKLPFYCIPAYLVKIDKLPLTTHGKIDRKALAELVSNDVPEQGTINSNLETDIYSIWEQILGKKNFLKTDNFFDIGGNSLLLLNMQTILTEHFNIEIKVADLFSHTTVIDLARYIDQEMSRGNSVSQFESPEVYNRYEKTACKDIAIIGIAGRFAEADNKEEYWMMLENGIDSVKDIPEDRFQDLQNFYQAVQKEVPDFYKGSYLARIDQFDYGFFGMSPKQAALTDPNQRIFLETAYEAIEDAGYGGLISHTKTGVYLGYSGDGEYKKLILEGAPDSYVTSLPDNLNSMIGSRLSYKLDLKGPSVLIDTACSSSLVAIHMACEAIRNGTCDLSVAGSIKINMFPSVFKEQIGIESSDGTTKTFSDNSDGTVIGEGAVAFLLKALDEAVIDRDSIYAVIRGSGINQDGNSLGITVPNPEGQAQAIISALSQAGANPDQIVYVEAHGTGTALGDPIEIEGLTNAFSQWTNKKQFCAIGSVKTNIGHLDHAAGAAGLLKAVMIINKKKIPPTLHFSLPNKKIPFFDTPFYVNNQLMPIHEYEKEILVGVNSFGLSGTNCHMVIGEPPTITHIRKYMNCIHIFTLSAHTQEALQRLIKRYSIFLDSVKQINLPDICYTVNTGREKHVYRLAIATVNLDDLEDKLAKAASCKFVSLCDEDIYFGKVDTDNSIVVRPEIQALMYQGSPGEQEKKYARLLCQQYVHGDLVLWEMLYDKNLHNRLHLPTYSFERERCWIDFGRKAQFDTYIPKWEINNLTCCAR